MGDVLSHRAGLPCVDKSLTLDEVFDWNQITSLLAAQAPFWKPGTEHGYHAYTLGFLGGELIHRVDPKHRSYSQFIREELDPEFYCGAIDDNVQSRIARLMSKEVCRPIVEYSIENKEYFKINKFDFFSRALLASQICLK